MISEKVREPLYEYMGGIIRGEGGILLEIGGMPDHVHLLAKIKKNIAVATMVGKIKGKSSKWRNNVGDPGETLPVAGRIWSFLGQRIPGEEGPELHPQSGRASPGRIVQG